MLKVIGLLPRYDTIIMTPSGDSLSEIVFRCLIRIIPHDVSYVNYFDKFMANDIYENMIDEEYIQDNFNDSNEIYNEIDRIIGLMNTENDGIFSYRYLMETEYKDIIIQSMKVNMGSHCDLKYADSINGKGVLASDDAIGTVGVVSESVDAILKMFSPKSITFVTLY